MTLLKREPTGQANFLDLISWPSVINRRAIPLSHAVLDSSPRLVVSLNLVTGSGVTIIRIFYRTFSSKRGDAYQ